VANDHFISRFLTKPWEFADQRLHIARGLRVFDFAKQVFDWAPSKSLFAQEGLTSPAVELMLNRYVETPAGKLADDIKAGLRLKSLDDVEWKTIRSLALLFALNPQRLFEARGETLPIRSLADLETGGESLMDATARQFLSRFAMFLVELRGEHDLCFPEVAMFPVPLPGQIVIGIPLGLRCALLMSRGNTLPPAGSLEELVENDLLPGLSLGIGGNSNRVVLSPGWRAAYDRDAIEAREALNTVRTSCRDLCKMIAKAGKTVGIANWEINE
jgi:hypothetical protein